MASWFSRGRPALFEALSTVCDQIDRELLGELRERGVQYDTAFEVDDGRPQAALSALERLSDEFEGVQAQTAALRASTAVTAAALATPRGQSESSPSTTVVKTQLISTTAMTKSPGLKSPGSASTEKDWKTEYSNLSLRFNALSDNFKKAKAALEKRKSERDRWMKHSELLQSKIAAAEEEHGIRILDRNSPAGSFSADSAKPQADASFTSENAGDRLVKQHSPATSMERLDEAVPRRTSPGSTEGEIEGALPPLPSLDDTSMVLIKHEPSSDTPMVVSERQVRKRRRSDAEASSNRKVKLEPSSDSSPSSSSDQHLALQESPDLGDALGRMSTPRKPKVWEDPRTLGLDSTSVITPTTLFSAKAIPKTTRDARFSSALTPISVNKRIVKSGGDKPAARRRKRDLANGIALLAEDGALYSMDATTPDTAISKVARGASHSKLSRLLDNVAEPEEAVSPSLPQARKAIATKAALPIPVRRELPFKKSSGQSLLNQSGRPATNTGRETAAQARVQEIKGLKNEKADKPSRLRSKRVSDLKLDDFKVNPAVNDGHDFAFSEVVRDKNERACLPGCIDMHCCGPEFRSLAESQRPKSPLSDQQRQEETELLEKYLGDNSYRLRNMPKQERTATWIEAKTKELADKYGRHRHRFSRMQSPPGFWNADFPSTQEMEAERSEAASRQKATIEERYKEAMRPGGRWLFRDE